MRFSELAKLIGYKDEQFSWSDEECLQNYVDWSAPASKGITLDYLKNNGFARLNVGVKILELHIKKVILQHHLENVSLYLKMPKTLLQALLDKCMMIINQAKIYLNCLTLQCQMSQKTQTLLWQKYLKYYIPKVMLF